MVGVLDEEAWRAEETNKRRRWASRFVMTLARAAQDVICFWPDSRELFAPTGQRRPDLVPVPAGVRVCPREQHHVFQRRRPLPEVPFVTLLAVLVHRPTSTVLLLLFIMVKSTLVVRASDALPLAASVDDEQVRLADALHPA